MTRTSPLPLWSLLLGFAFFFLAVIGNIISFTFCVDCWFSKHFSNFHRQFITPLCVRVARIERVAYISCCKFFTSKSIEILISVLKKSLLISISPHRRSQFVNGSHNGLQFFVFVFWIFVVPYHVVLLSLTDWHFDLTYNARVKE